MQLIFGTYTKGLFTSNLNPESGQLTSPIKISHLEEPTYFDLTTDQQLLTVGRIGQRGGVFNYKLEDYKPLLPLDQATTSGPTPVHVHVLDNLVLVSNYQTGVGQIYQLTRDGQLTLTDQLQRSGSSVLPQQTTSHVHFMTLAPDGRLLVLDLGTDEILTYDFDRNTGQLGKRVASFRTRSGFGPRQLYFDQYNGDDAYVLGELASQVAVLHYSSNTGTFTQRQLISTLPDDWIGNSGGGAIQLSLDGQFLYASNRGHDSIAIYQIQRTSTGPQLQLIDIVSCYGAFPRDFCLTPDGQYLVVGNQKSNSVVTFRINKTTGRLTIIDKIKVPEPVCVKVTA